MVKLGVKKAKQTIIWNGFSIIECIKITNSQPLFRDVSYAFDETNVRKEPKATFGLAYGKYLC